MRFPTAHLCLIGALFTAGAHAAPAAVSFDTTPRAGQHQRQHVDLKAVIRTRAEAGPEATEEQRAKIEQTARNLAQAGPMKLAVQMQQTLKVGQPDAQGWLPLTVATRGLGSQIEVGGNALPLPGDKPRDLSFAARFNPRDFGFEVLRVDGAPALDDALRSQGQALVGETLQLFKALSQRPMKPGDSVEVPLTMALPMTLPGGAGSMQSKLRYTLVRVQRGVAHFDLGMDLKMDINAPVPAPAAASAPEGEAAAAPQTMHIAVSGSGKGRSTLRLADRLPLASQLRLDMKMTMSMPDNGLMFMDMQMDMRSRGESLAKAAKPGTGKKKAQKARKP